MSEAKPTQEPKKMSKSPQGILEDAIKKSPANGPVESGKVGVAQAASGGKSGVEATNSPAVHGYDEVKPPRPVNAGDNAYSTPRSLPRNGAADYLVPRSSNYEPVCAPDDLSSSYDIPRPTSPASPGASPPGIQPPSSGYMALQTQPKALDHYSSRDNLPSAPAKVVTRSASKELITGGSREDLKSPNVLPRKSSRELVKTPSISRSLDVVLQKESSRCTWNTWLSIAAILVGVLSLVLSIASLGVSRATLSSNSMAVVTADLTNRVDGIQLQVQSVLSRRPNCSSIVYGNCSFNATFDIFSACVTDMLPEDSPMSGISCGIDISRGGDGVPLYRLELFTARLYHSSRGFGCRCTLSDSIGLLRNSSWVDDVLCVMVVSHCL